MANRYYWLALACLLLLVICLAQYFSYHEAGLDTLALRYKAASWLCVLGVILLGFKGWQVDHKE